MGASGRDPVRPDDVVALISKTDADIVFLQEAGLQSFSKDLAAGYSEYYQQPVERLNGRIERLHALWREAGYSIVVADRFSENPALLATRLPIVDEGDSFPLDEGSFAEATKGDSRSGRIVRVALPSSSASEGGEIPQVDSSGIGVRQPPQIALIVTHLHHQESRAALRGVRAAEVSTLLSHWQKATTSAQHPVVATVLASDLNFPRRSDHSPREWDVVCAGFKRLGEPTQDGVADELTSAGFHCAYDLSGKGAPTLTHWTGTTVDFAWCHFREGPMKWEVLRAEALPTELSDHLPVVTDLRWVISTLEHPSTE